MTFFMVPISWNLWRVELLLPLSIFILFLEYVDDILRGTRELKLAEGRTIATILRKEYPKLFAPTSGTYFDCWVLNNQNEIN